MKKVFLDTNIVADLFLKREPFCQNSLKLFALGFHKKNNIICQFIKLCNFGLSVS